jgi:hypothetical protein
MVMLDSARHGVQAPSLARWLLGLGIAATLAATFAHGLGRDLVGSAVAAWPAVALVGSYELLMMIVRVSQLPSGEVSPETERASAGVPDALQAGAAREFAGNVADGGMISIRAIRRGFMWGCLAAACPDRPLRTAHAADPGHHRSSGKAIADQFGRHGRWGRLVKAARRQCRGRHLHAKRRRIAFRWRGPSRSCR